MTTMLKALTLRSPWWWFILHGGKDIENRVWATDYRGPVLIHVSKWFDAQEIVEDAADCRSAMAAVGRQNDPTVSLGEIRAAGGRIVGRARIVDCVTSSSSPWFVGPYGFVLTDPEPFATHIPYKGARGRLFDVPAELIAA